MLTGPLHLPALLRVTHPWKHCQGPVCAPRTRQDLQLSRGLAQEAQGWGKAAGPFSSCASYSPRGKGKLGHKATQPTACMSGNDTIKDALIPLTLSPCVSALWQSFITPSYATCQIVRRGITQSLFVTFMCSILFKLCRLTLVSLS